MEDSKDVPLVHREQSWGENGTKVFELRLDIGRELTQTDQAAIYNAMYKLKRDLHEETCRVSPRFIIEKQNWLKHAHEILDEAGFVGHSWKEIENKYDPSYYVHLPWLVVGFRDSSLTIGWRKRVIVIDWSESTIKESANELFPKEDVTREGKMIHAWGYEDAQRYLAVLFSKLQK